MKKLVMIVILFTVFHAKNILPSETSSLSTQFSAALNTILNSITPHAVATTVVALTGAVCIRNLYAEVESLREKTTRLTTRINNLEQNPYGVTSEDPSRLDTTFRASHP